MTEESKTTASELANPKSEVDLLTRHLRMWMKASTDGEHGVITINCDFIKRLVAELRRLEKENRELQDESEADLKSTEDQLETKDKRIAELEDANANTLDAIEERNDVIRALRAEKLLRFCNEREQQL